MGERMARKKLRHVRRKGTKTHEHVRPRKHIRYNGTWGTKFSTVILLNKVPRVPKCPSASVPECASALQLPNFSRGQMLKCPSASSAWVPECPNAHRNLFECHWSDLRVPLECPLSARWVSNFPLSAIWLLFFYKRLFVFSFLGNKMCKFYHVLLPRCNDSKRFQKRSLNIL